MPEWKYTNKSVTKEEVEKSLAAVKSACFKCETHGVMELFTGYNKFLDALAVEIDFPEV